MASGSPVNFIDRSSGRINISHVVGQIECRSQSFYGDIIWYISGCYHFFLCATVGYIYGHSKWYITPVGLAQGVFEFSGYKRMPVAHLRGSQCTLESHAG